MTTTIIAQTVATVPTIDPMIGRFQLRLNGNPTGDVIHFRDLALSHLKACRSICRGAWELVDLRSGEVIPVDAMEAAALQARDDYEAREAAEGWGETPGLPAPCIVCGSEIGNVDRLADYEWLETDRPACLSCLQDAEAAWETHYHAVNS